MTESREPALESRWKNGAIWPDNHGVHINAHGGHIVHFGNLWYWYGEHKIEGWEGRLAWHGVHAYSSPDLRHWTDCGIVLPVVDDPRSPICRGCRIERPKVIFCRKTGSPPRFMKLAFIEGRSLRSHPARLRPPQNSPSSRLFSYPALQR